MKSPTKFHISQELLHNFNLYSPHLVANTVTQRQINRHTIYKLTTSCDYHSERSKQMNCCQLQHRQATFPYIPEENLVV